MFNYLITRLSLGDIGRDASTNPFSKTIIRLYMVTSTYNLKNMEFEQIVNNVKNVKKV